MKTTKMIFVLALIVYTLGACSSKSEEKATIAADGTKTVEFSFWLGKGEDAQYYPSYEENPILKEYLSKTYVGKDDVATSIQLSFQTPPIGSEKDNLSTLIATGDYTDIIDVDYYSGTVTDLYNEGIALDLTEYVEKYMPNYLAYLEKNPDLALTATNTIDGEKKYLSIRSYNTYVEQWQGFEYRRDWLVNYGKNPVSGEAFSGQFTSMKEDGTPDTNSWSDNVVFPSGGSHPVYISDWEWMFEIFEEAMAAEGISDGYCISIPATGYSQIGYLNAAFGGGTAGWYKTPDGKIEFGGNNLGMQAYLQCMNTWFEKGWIDPYFSQHGSDLPWRIDEVMVRQGKVGMWVGLESQFMNKMNTGEATTQNIVVFAAAYPMNDRYGDSSTQNVEPFSLYQITSEGKNFIITNKAKEKDLIALFTLFNEMYSEDNVVKNFYGYSKEEYEELKPEFYTQFGIIDGAYYDSELALEDGRKLYYLNDILANESGNLKQATAMQRIMGLQGDSSTVAVRIKRSPEMQTLYDVWNETYKNTGILSSSFKNQLSVDEAKEFAMIETRVDEFMSRSIPEFVMGQKDPFDEGQWKDYVKALDKYNPTRNTEIYQTLLNSLLN